MDKKKKEREREREGGKERNNSCECMQRLHARDLGKRLPVSCVHGRLGEVIRRLYSRDLWRDRQGFY